MNATAVLAGLEPTLVWERFAELTAIPRPPKQEEAARAWVLEWAAARGFESQTDEEGNVVVRVPATPGRESAPIVVLQSHLDMVCEREPESEYDPRAGRIRVELENDWVIAPETTLGADNGIGVAAALAVADDPDVEHGPLELLFTVSEEQGLDGAKALAPELVSGRLLLNLDGSSERSLTIGCAGSTHTFTRLALAPGSVPDDYVTLRVSVTGARGGHSGGDIGRGRANAIKSLGRVLGQTPLRLARLDGGVSRNALPREATAVIALPAAAEVSLAEAARRELGAIREQYTGTDDGVTLSIEHVATEGAADDATSARALSLLAVLPSSVLGLNPALPEKVETSTSLNVATTEDGVLTLASMTRSANGPALDEVVSGIESAARLANAEVEILRSYPPWRPDLDSRLLRVARGTFERLFEFEPALEVVHGGLECAVIGDKLPGVEMISLGPEIAGPHAPGERLNVPSTQRFYQLLTALLDDLCARPESP